MAATTKKAEETSAEDQAATAAAEARDAAATAAAEQATVEAAKADAESKASAKPAAAARTQRKPKGRVETFDATRPDGKVVTVVRNIDTGEQTVTVQE